MTVIPSWAGERSPGFQAGASGIIHGIRLSTSQFDIAQAILESLAIRLSIIYDALDAPDATIWASGGGFRSQVWGQMIADALGHPLHLTEAHEATATGVAALILNLSASLMQPQVAKVVSPNQVHHEQFRIARERHLALYKYMKDIE